MITFFYPKYYKDNLDIQIGFYPNKNLIFCGNWYPKLIIYVEIIMITTIITKLTNSTTIPTNQSKIF